MAKDVILRADLGGVEMSPDELAAIPDLAGIRKEVWEKFPGSVARKTYKPGELLMREGENGTTAFYILSGEVDVFVNAPIAHVESRKRRSRFGLRSWRKVDTLVTGRPVRDSCDGAARTYIPVDDGADLPLANPVVRLGSGELVGELSALAALKQERLKRPKFYPRSASVRAATDVTALELLPNILNNVLYNAPAFKDKLNRKYRQRALDSHLRSVPIFRDLSQDFLDFLRDRVELVDCQPGEVICRQGDPADAFYLVRLGFVKVSQQFPGGELVLNYLSRGSYFGEIGLLPPAFRVQAKGSGPGQLAEAAVWRKPVTGGRSPGSEPALGAPWDEYISREHFTMQAEGKRVRVTRLPTGKNPILFQEKPAETFVLSPGESFRIGGTGFEVLEDPGLSGRRTATCTALDFVQLVRIKAEDFAQLVEQFPEVEAAVTEVARARRQMDAQMLSRAQTVTLDAFLQQELMQGQDLLLIDLDKCTRCDECVRACVATHEDGYTRLIRDGLRFDHYLVPTSCRACLDPLCMTRCPVGSIRRKDTLDIVIEDWCIGCGNCAADCPYGNINVVLVGENGKRRHKAEPRPKAVVCDLCVEYPQPNCVRACPHDAALRVEPRNYFARDLAGIQLAVPAKPPAVAAAAPQGAPATRIYSNIGNLLSFLPRLRIVSGERAGTILQLRYPATTFGRGPENDYRFEADAKMSRTHCTIYCDGGRFFVRDQNSSNGTEVNSQPVSEAELHSGDIIRAGELELEFLEPQAP